MFPSHDRGGSFGGDVKVRLHNGSTWLFEGKKRKNGTGFKSLYDWLEPQNIDALFLKANNKPYLVVMTAEKFAEFQRGGE